MNFVAGCLGLELGRMPEALDLAQPARQRVPTGENLAHFFLENRREFRGSGFVPIRRRRLDVPTDPVVSLLRVLRLLPGDLVNHHLATYEDGPGHL